MTLGGMWRTDTKSIFSVRQTTLNHLIVLVKISIYLSDVLFDVAPRTNTKKISV